MSNPHFPPSERETIEEIRKKIDHLDDQILPLLENRFRYVLSIKRKVLTDKKREEIILKKCSSSSIKKVYRAIFREGKKARFFQRLFSKFSS